MLTATSIMPEVLPIIAYHQKKEWKCVYVHASMAGTSPTSQICNVQ